MNAKVQRPAVCNAMETLLVDQQDRRRSFCRSIGAAAGRKAGANCAPTRDAEAILKSEVRNPKSEIRRATEQDWFTEYNDYILNVRVVDGVQAGD